MQCAQRRTGQAIDGKKSSGSGEIVGARFVRRRRPSRTNVRLSIYNVIGYRLRRRRRRFDGDGGAVDTDVSAAAWPRAARAVWYDHQRRALATPTWQRGVFSAVVRVSAVFQLRQHRHYHRHRRHHRQH